MCRDHSKWCSSLEPTNACSKHKQFCDVCGITAVNDYRMFQVRHATSLCDVCSAISLPHNDYPIWDSAGDDIIKQGKLSRLQLEGVRYACQKHLDILPSGQRAGFFIGDGAGVGKGRQIAGGLHLEHNGKSCRSL
jgi:hypothetical protein